MATSDKKNVFRAQKKIGKSDFRPDWLQLELVSSRQIDFFKYFGETPYF